MFVSSISVYADFSSGPTEESPVAELGDMPADEVSADFSNYGPLKAPREPRSRPSSATAR